MNGIALLAFVVTAVTMGSSSNLEDRAKDFKLELEGLEKNLKDLRQKTNEVEAKGQLSNILNVGIGVIGTPPLVIGHLIQNNIAQATQIYADLLGEIGQAAPNAGLNNKPPANVASKTIITHLNQINSSFLKATRVAKDVINEFANKRL